LSNNSVSGKRWLKAELHTHCSLDPSDYRACRQTPEQLISSAAKLGYEVLSITCHNLDVWTDRLSDYAQNLGITLIPGMEVTAERTRHVLVYNFRSAPERLNTLAKIRNLSRKDTLVIAPHLFFPGWVSLRGLFEKHLDVFDAIEYSGFYIRGLDFNRRGVKLAKKVGKPVVGFSDAHHLWQLDRTFTWIYAEPSVESILSAIRDGAVRIQTSPYSFLEAANYWATALWRHIFPAKPLPSCSVPDAASSASQLNKIKDGRTLGAAQQSMKP
jgi:predicted metal-dependent phosphoesterase TrpH